MKTFAGIAGIFLLVWLGPVVLLTAVAAFIHLDTALLNPANWPMGARVLSSGWTMLSVFVGFCVAVQSP